MNKHNYLGTYIGKVVSVDDPQKQCRVRVHVYDIFDDVQTYDLPWAMLALPLGSRSGEGTMCPLQVGDEVTIVFYNGDTRRPIVTSSVHAIPDGKPTLPADLWQGEDKMIHKRTADEPEVPEPNYYEDYVIKQHGALIQFTKQGSIRATQINTGSAIEITPEGNIVLHCEKSIIASATELIQFKIGASSLDMTPSNITMVSPTIDLNP